VGSAPLWTAVRCGPCQGQPAGSAAAGAQAPSQQLPATMLTPQQVGVLCALACQKSFQNLIVRNSRGSSAAQQQSRRRDGDLVL